MRWWRGVVYGVGVGLVAAVDVGLAVTWLKPEGETQKGSVIFIHPDGTGLAHWTAARIRWYGPDGLLHWDRMPVLSVYRGHMKDALAATSHGGGTTHAYGVKVPADSYGMAGRRPLTSLSGQPHSILTEAMRRGLQAGIVNSGSLVEPGTAAFLARVPSRQESEAIVKQIVESGARIIMAGGEQWLLPEGRSGRHGPGARTDGLDLVAFAETSGYTVVYDRAELLAVDAHTDKLLGVFAHGHTFHDAPEEQLHATGLPLFEPNAPTLAEMTSAALRLLSARDARFLLVVEEEGTDNFGNHNNARGVLEALRRADDAIGVARAHLQAHPDTLLITAADSDAGGLQLISPPRVSSVAFRPDRPLPATTRNGAPLDGKDGTETPPFVAAPDQFGAHDTFGIAWTGFSDNAGGILTRAEGLNSARMAGSIDNTDIYRMMYLTLFGTLLP